MGQGRGGQGSSARDLLLLEVSFQILEDEGEIEPMH
jgi:hypothetical protein